jgi:hypothetical protein
MAWQDTLELGAIDYTPETLTLLLVPQELDLFPEGMSTFILKLQPRVHDITS